MFWRYTQREYVHFWQSYSASSVTRVSYGAQMIAKPLTLNAFIQCTNDSLFHSRDVSRADDRTDAAGHVCVFERLQMWDVRHAARSTAAEQQQHIRRIVSIIDSELPGHHIKFQSPLSTFQALLLPDKQPTWRWIRSGSWSWVESLFYFLHSPFLHWWLCLIKLLSHCCQMSEFSTK